MALVVGHGGRELGAAHALGRGVLERPVGDPPRAARVRLGGDAHRVRRALGGRALAATEELAAPQLPVHEGAALHGGDLVGRAQLGVRGGLDELQLDQFDLGADPEVAQRHHPGGVRGGQPLAPRRTGEVRGDRRLLEGAQRRVRQPVPGLPAEVLGPDLAQQLPRARDLRPAHDMGVAHALGPDGLRWHLDLDRRLRRRFRRRPAVVGGELRGGPVRADLPGLHHGLHTEMGVGHADLVDAEHPQRAEPGAGGQNPVGAARGHPRLRPRPPLHPELQQQLPGVGHARDLAPGAEAGRGGLALGVRPLLAPGVGAAGAEVRLGAVVERVGGPRCGEGDGVAGARGLAQGGLDADAALPVLQAGVGVELDQRRIELLAQAVHRGGDGDLAPAALEGQQRASAGHRRLEPRLDAVEVEVFLDLSADVLPVGAEQLPALGVEPRDRGFQPLFGEHRSRRLGLGQRIDPRLPLQQEDVGDHVVVAQDMGLPEPSGQRGELGHRRHRPGPAVGKLRRGGAQRRDHGGPDLDRIAGCLVGALGQEGRPRGQGLLQVVLGGEGRPPPEERAVLHVLAPRDNAADHLVGLAAQFVVLVGVGDVGLDVRGLGLPGPADGLADALVLGHAEARAGPGPTLELDALDGRLVDEPVDRGADGDTAVPAVDVHVDAQCATPAQPGQGGLHRHRVEALPQQHAHLVRQPVDSGRLPEPALDALQQQGRLDAEAVHHVGDAEQATTEQFGDLALRLGILTLVQTLAGFGEGRRRHIRAHRAGVRPVHGELRMQHRRARPLRRERHRLVVDGETQLDGDLGVELLPVPEVLAVRIGRVGGVVAQGATVAPLGSGGHRDALGE